VASGPSKVFLKIPWVAAMVSFARRVQAYVEEVAAKGQVGESHVQSYFDSY
jgi:hypothetical protein